MVGLQEHSVHLWGEDLRKQIQDPALSDYSYISMHGGYLRMTLTRSEKPYTYPLSYPAQGKLRGYDWRDLSVDGNLEKSIKEIVVLTGWMATGLIAWKGKAIVPTKKHCPGMFQELIGSSGLESAEQAAESFTEIINLCRETLYYRIPKDQKNHDKLVALLPQVLDFENFFMRHYQNFLIDNLSKEDPVRVRTSIIRLGEIIYPNDFSLQALQKVEIQNASQDEKLEKSLKVLNSL